MKKNKINTDVDLFMQKSFYRPYCNAKEIERIFNVQNNEDYLLKMRADEVADHVRLYRVMRARMHKTKNWDFTEHFSKVEFDNYIKRLSKGNQNKLSNVAMGFVFSNDPNGSCMKTKFGNVIIISESLRYFLFFMNLHFLDAISNVEIPVDVKQHSLLIAIRTMLKTESLDFELDPRGIIPSEIEDLCNILVQQQIEFVIGHECAHYLLGHLNQANMVEEPLYRMLSHEEWENVRKHTFYNYKQQHEFEADINSFKLAKFHDSSEFENFISGAFLFFIYLDIYRSVSEVIFPPMGQMKTHPDPIDRMWNLYTEFEADSKKMKGPLESLLKYTSQLKTFLQEDVGYNIDNYETYGSVYLGQWRGPVLIDRVDY
ncbi:hypothetical protein [Bacillus cereus]|uniref:Uncharacterized protein n=1 Tax=Bacillus cereus TaxID=1396 RepID=A0A9X7LVD4_BACCE|nr:hypothetical protein [Bacillus cereus]QDZ73457.1 hypothetical protein D0437_10215 [Bacillus cereus]